MKFDWTGAAIGFAALAAAIDAAGPRDVLELLTEAVGAFGALAFAAAAEAAGALPALEGAEGADGPLEAVADACDVLDLAADEGAELLVLLPALLPPPDVGAETLAVLLGVTLTEPLPKGPDAARERELPLSL